MKLWGYQELRTPKQWRSIILESVTMPALISCSISAICTLAGNTHKRKYRGFCVIFSLALLVCTNVYAQEGDSARKGLPAKNKNIFQIIGNAITRKSIDSTIPPDILISRNDTPFLAYEGKGIRHIIVREFGFDKTFADTAKKIDYFGKDFVKKLHRNTREWVIRNNLFIREKTTFRANLVADNELHLRSLDYIHDARILVTPIEGEPDSIDLVVMTKDFLSITLQISNATSNRFRGKIGDANLLGMGQKVQVSTLLERNREPHSGYEISYRNSSIAETFVNATIVYSTISPDLNDGSRDEQAWHAQIERPLVSQYLHFAGGAKFSHGQTNNNYTRPDSVFINYRYNTFDAWVGYNLGVRKFLFLKSVMNRQFISLRYYNNKFTQVPYQIAEKFNFKFNDQEALLAQFTFFRKNFYKTNYVFGFGITEDVPYGYNIALTGGWYQQLHMERAYLGADVNKYVVSSRGKIIQYFLRTGGFLSNGKIQDAAALLGVSKLSRIYTLKNFRIRQYLRLSYTKQINRIGLDPLGINNVFGLPYISTDSASGNQRANLHTETRFFMKYKLLGFKFALFASADFAFLIPESQQIPKSGFYSGFGGGIRTRNENTLFNTIELRFMYFPRKSAQHDALKLTLTPNFRFRYSSSYVKPPDIIQVNSDYYNNIH